MEVSLWGIGTPIAETKASQELAVAQLFESSEILARLHQNKRGGRNLLGFHL